MSTSALIARMVAAGMPPELIGDIAAELGRADAERAILAQRRQNERDRKARSREVTGQHVTERDGADSQTISPNDIYSNPLGSPHPTETSSPTDTPKAKNHPFPCPAGVETKHWRDLLANRKRKRLANTETAYADLLSDLARIADDEWPPGRLVQHAAAKGWGGIYDPRKSEHRNGNSRPEQSLRGSRPDPAIDLLRQARAEFAAEGADENQGADSGTRPSLPSYLTG